jgi:2-haloacid dehalogenase
MATLTNSVASIAEAQVRNAGIAHVFEKVLSADEVSQLKPAPAPYLMAAESFGVPVEQTCLIAAHAWDISGALAAGCAAAFVRRPGAVLSPVGPRPGIIGRDISEVADLLLEGARRRLLNSQRLLNTSPSSSLRYDPVRPADHLSL